jgi:membrane-associated phospholipid phosphatase
MTRRKTALAVLAVMLAVYVVMAFAAARYDTFPGDHAMMQAAQEVGWFEPVAHFFNVAVDNWIIRIGAGLFVVAFLITGKWPLAIAFSGVWFVPVLSWASKLLVDRPRPEGNFEVHLDPGTTSFPSGHSFDGAMFATLVALGALRWLPPVQARIVVAGCVVFAALTGFSRFWLGVHWLSDAVGGWLLGVWAAGVAWLVAEYVVEWRQRARERTPLA